MPDLSPNISYYTAEKPDLVHEKYTDIMTHRKTYIRPKYKQSKGDILDLEGSNGLGGNTRAHSE